MDGKKVIITGGAGFLGHFVVSKLAESGVFSHIKVVDLKAADEPFENKTNVNIEIVGGVNICNPERLCREFADADCVVHLAGIVSFSLKDRELLQRVNVEGTGNVLAAVAKCGIERFVHVSSVAALGFADDENILVDEDFKFDWSIAEKYRKYYMLSKHQADVEVEKAIANGLNAATLYPGLMFGPGDKINSARWIAAIKAGKMPFNMPGGTNVVDVRDVARGVAMAAADSEIKGDFLLSGANLGLREMNDVIAKSVNTNGPKRTLPRSLREFMFRLLLGAEMISKKKLQLTADNVDSAFRMRYFDNSKAKRVFGWSPEISFQQTVKDTIEWMATDGQFK